MEAKKPLEDRLRKSGISPDEFSEMVWERLEPKIAAMLKRTRRERILAAVISGLSAKWSFGDHQECTSAQRLAEYAERLTDAGVLAESRRTQ